MLTNSLTNASIFVDVANFVKSILLKIEPVRVRVELHEVFIEI